MYWPNQEVVNYLIDQLADKNVFYCSRKRKI